MNRAPYWYVAFQLFMTDVKMAKQFFFSKVIDISIWITCSLFVNAYLLPKFGIAPEFGMITFGGMLASAGIFEGYNSIITLVGDLSGDKITYYYATLPLPSWLMLSRMILSNACLYTLLALSFLPFGKLLLWSTFDLSLVNWFHFALIMVVANLFYGAFTLFTTSFIGGFYQMGSVWSRFIFPLWFLGGFCFSWQSLYQTSQPLAYVSLLNPIIYISEGYRSALMGPEGWLNFWLCLGATALFGIAAGWIGIRRLKRRCDFI